jgi:hypothetical protein
VTHVTPEQALEELKASALKVLDSFLAPTPVFQLNIGWATSYDDLFAKRVRQTPEADVLQTAVAKGRVLLTGRGGGGKSCMLRRIARQALDQGVVPVLVDLRNWTGADYQKWVLWTASGLGEGAAYLFEHFASPPTSLLALDLLPPNIKKLLIVDGLNEISGPVGQQILTLLDDVVRDQIGTSVIVSDRLVRRELPSQHRWALGHVLPLSQEEIAKHYASIDTASASDRETLSSPYFLDVAIKNGLRGTGRAQWNEVFLKEHGVSLSDDELDQVSPMRANLGELFFSRPSGNIRRVECSYPSTRRLD